MSTEPEIFEVKIQKYSPKGYGVGAIERKDASSMSVEIAHTVVGDVAQIEMRRKMRPPRKGRLLEVLTPSPDRAEPRCAHARVCGGCCWQQIDYSKQLSQKEKLVSELFNRPVNPIIGSQKCFEYRNKMEFSFSENRAGQKFLGLMIAQAEPYVFNVEHCHLCSPWFSDVLEQVRSWWQNSSILAYHPHRDEGTLRYLTLRESVHTGQKMAILNIANRSELSIDDTQKYLHQDFVRAVQEGAKTQDISIFLRVHEANRGKPTYFREVHLAGPDHIVEKLHVRGQILSFKISPSSFFQPNTLQAEKLYEAALSYIAHFDRPVVYDLYCGTGTLGMVAASIASQVIGIELSQEAVKDARENAARNKIEKIQFYAGDTGKVLTELMAKPSFKHPDVVIVDPPRAGLDPLALHHLKTLSPKAILYISCNPTTQEANIQELLEAGYELKALQPVDQFPHTYHIENIAFLER